MVVDESGDDGSSLKVDRAGVRTRQSSDVLIGANGHDAIAANRNGPRDRKAVVDGDDLSVRQDQVGGELLRSQNREDGRNRQQAGHRHVFVVSCPIT